MEDYYKIDGVKNIKLHQLYRSMAWLGEELPKKQQPKIKFKSPRCVKDLIEEYILGARMRKTNEVKKNVLVRGGRYKEKKFKRLK